MLKRYLLICILGSIAAFSIHAAEDAKAPATPAPVVAKPNEAAGKITLPEPSVTVAPKKKSKWSNPNLDLTHCLNRASNPAIIKCAE